MYVPARLYSTPSLLPELPYHLSGKTLSVLAVLPTVSLTDHDQCIATYKCLCVCVQWDEFTPQGQKDLFSGLT